MDFVLTDVDLGLNLTHINSEDETHTLNSKNICSTENQEDGELGLLNDPKYCNVNTFSTTDHNYCSNHDKSVTTAEQKRRDSFELIIGEIESKSAAINQLFSRITVRSTAMKVRPDESPSSALVNLLHTLYHVDGAICSDGEVTTTSKDSSLGWEKFKCSHCDRRFRTSSGLNDHLKLHNGGYQHRCSHCDRAFRRPSELQDHIFGKHMQIKRFMCPTCGMKLKTRANYLLHFKRRHGKNGLSS